MDQTYARDREEWRRWLEENHQTASEIWLVYYKKPTGKPSVGYRESVEEALCFGWIDGIKRKIDEERYTHRFTPRNKGSKWSPLNIRLAEKMIRQERMTAAGLEAYRQRKEHTAKALRARASQEIPLTPEIEKALRQNMKAWKNFNNLAPSYKKQYAGWLVSAKKEETRQRRLEVAIRLLEKNQKLGMK